MANNTKRQCYTGKYSKFLILPTAAQIKMLQEDMLEKKNSENDRKLKKNTLFVFKIITGVGIPVDLDLETVTMGFVFKVGFLLPKNVSELAHELNDPFDVSTHQLAPPKRRSLDDYASNESDANDIEDENLYESSNGNSNRVATMRWNVYKGLAKYAER